MNRNRIICVQSAGVSVPYKTGNCLCVQKYAHDTLHQSYCWTLHSIKKWGLICCYDSLHSSGKTGCRDLLSLSISQGPTLMLITSGSQSMFQFILNVLDGGWGQASQVLPHQMGKKHLYGAGFVHRGTDRLKPNRVKHKVLPQSWKHSDIIWCSIKLSLPPLELRGPKPWERAPDKHNVVRGDHLTEELQQQLQCHVWYFKIKADSMLVSV